MELSAVFLTLPHSSARDFYTCFVTKDSNLEIRITQRNSEIKAFLGDHSVGKSDEDVEHIIIENVPMDFFPRGLHEIYPHLKYLEVKQCGLKEITAEDLKGLEKLEDFDFSNNSLTLLPTNLLEHMKLLKRVDLSNNKLKFISSRLLSGEHLSQLEFVDFRGNTVIDAHFDIHEDSAGENSLQSLITIIEAKCNPPVEDAWLKKAEEFRGNLFESIKGLWLTGVLSDFIVEAGNQEFKVHKNILGAQSSVFLTMFQCDMQERKTHRLRIIEFGAAAVEEFLRYLYLGTLTSRKFVLEIFELANKYNVEPLVSITEEIILQSVDKWNAIDVLAFGHLYNSEAMKEAGFRQVKVEFPSLSIPDRLSHEPEKLRKLIEGKQTRDKIIKAAEEAFNAILKECEM